ncbi:hypothetical protein [Kitasatospora sp. GP30]|uniref:hypothetical protein n=1 Tax=Kitasatospora sp. GP30 TaxID=3035084 RepID=UPI0015D5A3E1|nr:hypothetical protein [Kitasatospora sp. GP30]
MALGRAAVGVALPPTLGVGIALQGSGLAALGAALVAEVGMADGAALGVALPPEVGMADGAALGVALVAGDGVADDAAVGVATALGVGEPSA